MSKTVLLVDPHLEAHDIRSVRRTLLAAADLTVACEFFCARQFLRETAPDLLVTNLRLGAYNGLHLALLSDRSRTRCIVYDRQTDPVLIRKVQEAYAFYERPERLPFALPSYLKAELPARDRRDHTDLARRQQFRGGRRSSDLPALPRLL